MSSFGFYDTFYAFPIGVWLTVQDCLCPGQNGFAQYLFQAHIVAVAGRFAMDVSGQTRRAGQRVEEDMRFFIYRALEHGCFRTIKYDGGHGRHGGELPGAAVVGDQ